MNTQATASTSKNKPGKLGGGLLARELDAGSQVCLESAGHADAM